MWTLFPIYIGKKRENWFEKNNIIQRDNSKISTESFRDYVEYVVKKLYEAEVRINRFEQYTRRENIEIIGIPDSIKHDDFEKTVLKIVNSIGVHTDS